MRNIAIISLLTFAAGALVLPTACRNQKNAVAAAVEPNYSLLDTIKMIKGKPFCYASDEFDNPNFVYNGEVISYDPTLRFKRLESELYDFDNLGRHVEISLADTTDLHKLRDMDRQLPGHGRYRYHLAAPENRIASLTLDMPDDNPQLADWITALLEKTIEMDVDPPFILGYYTACKPKLTARNVDELGQLILKRYDSELAQMVDSVYPQMMEYDVDLRSRLANSRFSTYRLYCFEYFGGAHGLYSENLISYDVANNLPINNEYLFKPEAMDSVWDVVMIHAAHRACIMQQGDDESSETLERNAREWFQTVKANTENPVVLPQAGVAEDGFVFSFQPYEIGCFADGCFHIKVPWQKLAPYLTPRGRALFAE